MSLFLSFLLQLPVRLYRTVISPLLPVQCRFYPSCSHYALEALHRHGPGRGLWLSARRLSRCHPWGGAGFDPVPDTLNSHEPPKGADPFVRSYGERQTVGKKTTMSRRKAPGEPEKASGDLSRNSDAIRPRS